MLTIVGCPAADRISSGRARGRGIRPRRDGCRPRGRRHVARERRELTERLRGGRAAREMPFGPDSLTRVIAVTSGKGGVGKSTVTANLAVALAGARSRRSGSSTPTCTASPSPALLGLVDADGNVPQPTRIDDLMLPPVAYGVKVISIGMFLRRANGEAPVGAVAWRGPMLHRTVQQFLTDVYFGDLDVLLLDMPPGTGDIAISVGQLLPHAEVARRDDPPGRGIRCRRAQRARRAPDRSARDRRRGEHGGDDPSRRHVLELFGAGAAGPRSPALSTAGAACALLASIPLSTAPARGRGCRNPGRRRASGGPRRGRDRSAGGGRSPPSRAGSRAAPCRSATERIGAALGRLVVERRRVVGRERRRGARRLVTALADGDRRRGTRGAHGGTGASSSSASRMIRRGSYWRGSSVRQSTSSNSEPISSFIRVLAVVMYSRAGVANRVRLST